jgi:hypothetical protein
MLKRRALARRLPDVVVTCAPPNPPAAQACETFRVHGRSLPLPSCIDLRDTIRHRTGEDQLVHKTRHTPAKRAFWFCGVTWARCMTLTETLPIATLVAGLRGACCAVNQSGRSRTLPRYLALPRPALGWCLGRRTFFFFFFW